MLQKFIILSFVVTLVVALHVDNDVDYQKVVESFLANRCKTNGGPTALDDLKKVPDNLPPCVWESFPKNTPESEKEFLQLICTDIQPKLYSCLVSVLDVLEPCLDEEEKYLTNFASGFFNSTFEDHCKDGGAIILDHEHDIQDLACEAANYTNRSVFEECFSTSSVIKDMQEPDFVIRKDSLCTYLEHGNKCLLDILQEHCKERVYKFVEFHLRPTKAWCTKYVNEVDS